MNVIAALSTGIPILVFFYVYYKLSFKEKISNTIFVYSSLLSLATTLIILYLSGRMIINN